CANGIAALDYW
nr:immunoglobulin heavy chain junction region [Macaca mulatta]MOW46981.1 immunoglobulin heavy chain junction region [Macaca mulatta]MOW47339.1 immunoglobulin heavy chain junction region [Macaca mulatta]MOW47493.1 immunoglobulin heavy chain junction region [Macaca mulatta]MOW47855.1 immunoglobulin heavy chain junction region [Macaca mulatta]